MRLGGGEMARATPCGHTPTSNSFTKIFPSRLNRISELTVRGSWNATVAQEDDPGQTHSLSSVKARFNVAVDMFLHADPEPAQNETTAQYEIMVWVGSNDRPKPLGYSKGVQMVQSTANRSL
jgi:hypothetical protein